MAAAVSILRPVFECESVLHHAQRLEPSGVPKRCGDREFNARCTL